MNDADADTTTPLFPSQARTRAPHPPRKAMRKISKVPFKVLDAPGCRTLYLNLVDWSALNARSSGSEAALTSASSPESHQALRLGPEDVVTSVSDGTTWQRNEFGGDADMVELQCKKVRTLRGHMLGWGP